MRDLQERLGYAHTLANHFAKEALRNDARARSYGLKTETGQWYVHFASEAWRRYDRVTRFLYEHTQV